MEMKRSGEFSVFDGLAVADDVAVESVGLPQQLGQEPVGCRHRLSVPVVVAAHDFHRMDARDDLGEGVEEDLVQVPGIDLGIGAAVAVPSAGRDAVSGEMLHDGFLHPVAEM